MAEIDFNECPNIIELFNKKDLQKSDDKHYRTNCPCCGSARVLQLNVDTNCVFHHGCERTFFFLETVALIHGIITCDEGRVKNDKRNPLSEPSIFRAVVDTIKKEYPAEFYNRVDEYLLSTKPKVITPRTGVLHSTFITKVADIMSDKFCWFYNAASDRIVYLSYSNGHVSIEHLTPRRCITDLERYIKPGKFKTVKVETVDERGKKVKEEVEIFETISTTKDAASILIDSEIIREKLPPLDYVSQVPVLYKNDDGRVLIHARGYSADLRCYVPRNAPQIKKLSLEKAKSIILDIYSDFRFKDEQSAINAISHLLTPAMRTIASRINIRTPFYMFEANASRAGKEYCAAISRIVFENTTRELPPIADGSRHRNDEELRKTIITLAIHGHRSLHFANNRGKLDSVILEQFITDEHITGRLLGGHNDVDLLNIHEISGSGNVGYSMSTDLMNRTRFVRLHLMEEDPNKRTFKRVDLHGYVRKNRGLILSAIFTLYMEWYNAGCPKKATPFASFPDWANIVGNVMVHAGIGDPCTADYNTGVISPDQEQEDMKILFRHMGENYLDQPMNKKELTNTIINDDLDIFTNFSDIQSDRSSQMKFSELLNASVGRVLGGVFLMKDETPKQRRAHKYIFTSPKPVVNHIKLFENNPKNDNLDYLDNLSSQNRINKKKFSKKKMKKVAEVVEVVANKQKLMDYDQIERELSIDEDPQCQEIYDTDVTNDQILSILREKGKVSVSELYETLQGNTLFRIKEMIKDGLLIVSKDKNDKSEVYIK